MLAETTTVVPSPRLFDRVTDVADAGDSPVEFKIREAPMNSPVLDGVRMEATRVLSPMILVGRSPKPLAMESLAVFPLSRNASHPLYMLPVRTFDSAGTRMI